MKTRIVHKCILIILKKLNVIGEIMHATRKYYKDWQSEKEASNQQKTIILPTYSPGHGEFESLYFVLVAWTVNVSRAFV